MAIGYVTLVTLIGDLLNDYPTGLGHSWRVL
jgi:hypothetical protein